VNVNENEGNNECVFIQNSNEEKYKEININNEGPDSNKFEDKDEGNYYSIYNNSPPPEAPRGGAFINILINQGPPEGGGINKYLFIHESPRPRRGRGHE